MIGIVNKSPAIEIRFGNTPDSYPVSTSGQGVVMVSLANGNIQKGDYITSSPIEGVGMKATVAGPIIGVALEDAISDDESTITKIQVNLQKDYNVEPLMNVSGFSSNPFQSNTTNVTKYIMGGGILILTLVFSFMYFGRLSMKGVEALGRNPLASKKIHVGIILNVTLAIAICIIGFITAIYIIRF
jgi:F0F1-type ATP synthase membrane subunit c/vacuolar-type H+-ATPase subunit K